MEYAYAMCSVHYMQCSGIASLGKLVVGLLTVLIEYLTVLLECLDLFAI